MSIPSAPASSEEGAGNSPALQFKTELVRAAFRILNRRREYSPQKLSDDVKVEKKYIESLIRGQIKIIDSEALLEKAISYLHSNHLNDAFLGPLLMIINDNDVSADYAAYSAMTSIFKVTSDELGSCGEYLSGKYISYKYTPSGKIAIDVLEIHSPSNTIPLSTFSTSYKKVSHPDIFIARGYVLPVEKRFYALCGIANDVSDKPEPYFVIFTHPAQQLGKVAYLRGVILDTTSKGHPYASCVYCGRIDNHESINLDDTLGERNLNELEARLKEVLQEIIGVVPIIVSPDAIPPDKQSILFKTIVWKEGEPGA